MNNRALIIGSYIMQPEENILVNTEEIPNVASNVRLITQLNGRAELLWDDQTHFLKLIRTDIVNNDDNIILYIAGNQRSNLLNNPLGLIFPNIPPDEDWVIRLYYSKRLYE